MSSNFNVKIDGVFRDLDDVLVRRDFFSEGTLWACGYNNAGQLGDNTATHKSSPIQTVAGGINWKTIKSGGYFSTGIKTDGTLWSWGQNIWGNLGDNTGNPKSSPVQTIAGGTNWKSVDGGVYHTAAIKTDNTLWLWGDATSGQLGDNSNVPKSSPVQTVAGGTNWKQVSCGIYFTAGIKTDGTLWTWGDNAYGQLGDGTVINKSSPVQTVAGGTNWKSVSCGQNHTSAIKTDGTLWTWGQGVFGQMGNNGNVSQSSPIQTVAGGTNWKIVNNGFFHTTAIKTDGTLWIWGYGVSGQLGDNTLGPRSSPVQTITGGTNWKQVDGGSYHTIALKTDGTVWTWGQNLYGQLGDNTIVNKSSPIQTITGGTNWKQISAGAYHILMLTDLSI